MFGDLSEDAHRTKPEAQIRTPGPPTTNTCERRLIRRPSCSVARYDNTLRSGSLKIAWGRIRFNLHEKPSTSHRVHDGLAEAIFLNMGASSFSASRRQPSGRPRHGLYERYRGGRFAVPFDLTGGTESDDYSYYSLR